MPKEARTFLHGEKQTTRKEVHKHTAGGDPCRAIWLFPLPEHGRLLTSVAIGINTDSAGINSITIFSPALITSLLTTQAHADQPIRHLPAHHTHHVSSTTILQTAMEASIFTAQHNTPSYIPVSRRISSK
jgi:hypothetical protein